MSVIKKDKTNKGTYISKQPSPIWDNRELIKRAGGPIGIRRKAEDLGYAVPTQSQIYMWNNRNSIPADWVAVLLLLADARGECSAPRQVIANLPQDFDLPVEEHDPFS